MLREVFKLRDCGILKIATVSTYQESLSKTLKRLGFFDNTERLDTISVELAREIIARILWKDLAYSAELMPKNKAYEFADNILDEYHTRQCTIYTNSTWEECKTENLNLELSRYNPMTNATFDSGIIIKHPNYCFCIWVEDED